MKRFKTRVVYVGKVPVGGDNPIRIQSMTTSDTRDVDATVDQIKKLADFGCEIARVTVQGKKEAASCEFIKNKLVQQGYDIPVVADIHFYPPAAMMVADFVDKVRVNPGNYVDRRATFKVLEYDDETYQKEIEKIEEGFSPLVLKLKKLGKSMRIGTNHGSLSDRIMNRFGDTPKGMVESALEFTRVCRKLDYHDIIYSMKASNPLVMIEAYRLLVLEMKRLGWNYPLHLGVTEAGEGEDGRVKSSIGIGSLLLDGLGDTIRVSLTEDPWLEIDPCKRLIRCRDLYENKEAAPFEEKHRDFQNISRREVTLPKNTNLGMVFLRMDSQSILEDDFYEKIGCKVTLNTPEKDISTVDGLIFSHIPEDAISRKKLESLKKIGVQIFSFTQDSLSTPIVSVEQAKGMKKPFALMLSNVNEVDLSTLHPEILFFQPTGSRIHSARKFFDTLKTEAITIPAVLHFSYEVTGDDLIIQASAEMGSLLCDGLGEGIFIDAPSKNTIYSLSFSILQGARLRTIKTEFISCPGCGRTLFDLQEVSKRIRDKTHHLPGVKIAIMGCIVNGPGEMADADFGYVGSRPGKVDLYVGKTCVEKNIDFVDADERLIDLIKAHNKWIDPVQDLLDALS